MISHLQWLLVGLMGLGLASATGLRVFLPILGLAVAAYFLNIPLTKDMQWLASPTAITVLAISATLEVILYYIPNWDHKLDVLMSPLSLIAGMLMAGAIFIGIENTGLRWSVAALTGGISAGFVQACTVASRAMSSATTGGLGNVFLATSECVGAAVLAITALFIPVFISVVFGFMFWFIWWMYKRYEESHDILVLDRKHQLTH